MCAYVFPLGMGAGSCMWTVVLFYQMRVLELLDDGDVVELDVEELVDRLQRAAD